MSALSVSAILVINSSSFIGLIRLALATDNKGLKLQKDDLFNWRSNLFQFI